MKKPLIIFDFDGVLADTVDFFAREASFIIKKLGYNFINSREDLFALFKDNIAVSLIEHGVTPVHMCAIWEHIQEAAKKEEIKLCPGVLEMLDALAPNCEMAIVSSNSSNTIRGVLTRFGIINRFRSISGGEDEFEKVDRIKKCLASACADPDFTFYVGDTLGDVDEAHQAGVNAVAAAWGWHPAEFLSTASPDLIIKKPQELVDYINLKVQ